MFIKQTRLVSGVIGLIACFVAGCETIDRARTAQASAASVTNDVPAAVRLPHVNLHACKFVNFVEYAMTNRPDLAASRLAVSNAFLALTRVSSSRSLQIGLNGGFSQSTFNGSHFSWHQRRGKASGELMFDLLLVDFGRVDAQERQARENLIGLTRTLEEREFQVFYDVTKAYFTLLQNDALLAVAQTNEHQYAVHLRQAEHLFDAGEAQKLDVLKARVDLSDARLMTINASNDVMTAAAEFLRTLGLQADRATRETVLPSVTNRLAETKRELPVTKYDAVAGLALARTNAPSLKALRANVRAASSEVDYAVADLMPELSLSSAFSFSDPAWNWSWGFRAVQSLFTGYRKTTAVDMAVVGLQTARTELEAAEHALSRDLAVAVATRDNARQSLVTARVEVAQAEENLQTVIEQYRVGAASRIDFTDAASRYASALGTRVKAFYAEQMAEAALIRLTGAVPSFTRKEKNGKVD